jgi:transcriptional regulator GlxA family with amidase domain
MNAARRIGLVAFDRVQALDIVGPSDAFATANDLAEDGRAPYELLVLAPRKGVVKTESGLRLVADASLDDAPPLDTVVIPGGAGVRLNAATRAHLAVWLKRRARRIRRVTSVCTGIYALAESGLLDGIEATTHWAFAADVSSRWPRIKLDANAIYVKSGRYYTSAGITAGIDLALAMIEEDVGSAVALKVARHLVVYVKRPGGQLQYSEPLRLQELGGGKLTDTFSWMLEHLSGDLSVQALAEHANLSPRHFARKFKAAYRTTTAEFVEALRLDHARWLLANESSSIDDLAAAVGYGSDDAFRRAFARRFGTVPSDYRRRLAGR